MKKMMTTILLTAAVASQITACSNRSSRDKSADGGKLVVTANKEKMNSSELTSAGEQLMSPFTWMLADKVFDMALEKDPSDVKAQFYKALLKPFMLTRGMAMRMKPFTRTYGDIAKLETNIKNFPESPMKNFLLDGKEDIATMQDVQNVLVQQRQAFSDFRKFLKLHQDIEMSIYLNPNVWQDELQQRAYDSCLVTSPTNANDDMSVECNYSQIAVKKMNSADIVALRQAVAGMILYYQSATNYSVEGLDKIYGKLAADQNLTPKQTSDLIMSVPTIGKLRQDQGFAEVLDIGADLAAAGRWALQYQANLCAHGPDAINRKGYVLESGICITDQSEAERSLAVLTQALQGPFAATLVDAKTGNDTKTILDARTFLSKPPQDLRSLAPADPTCGHAVLPDKTFGGLFPQGDASTFLMANCGN